MKRRAFVHLVWLLVMCSTGSAQAPAPAHRVTLYSCPNSPKAVGPSQLSFERGDTGLADTQYDRDFDLYYGSLHAGDDCDWFFIGIGRADERSVLRDLGPMKWKNVTSTPVVCPRPRLQQGEVPTEGLDTPASSRGDSPDGYFIKAVLGHMYVMRIKTDTRDQYVLFRVEELERRTQCTLKWRSVPHPDSQKECPEDARATSN
jgi:hypothetical protein